MRKVITPGKFQHSSIRVYMQGLVHLQKTLHNLFISHPLNVPVDSARRKEKGGATRGLD